tara:strand:+ start:262 stop:414 length:153 start_codon:yes stop_codon:yes gene_type:complete
MKQLNFETLEKYCKALDYDDDELRLHLFNLSGAFEEVERRINDLNKNKEQ